MLELLRQRAARQKLENVTRVLNTQGGTGLAPSTCDIALLVDVYHEFSDPSAMLSGLRDALKPAGELVVVEYREEDPAVPIKPRHKMSKAQVHKELTAHGFKLVRELDTLPWQHAMFYQRSDGPGTPVEPKPWKARR
jgi:predicted methyltransferase